MPNFPQSAAPCLVFRRPARWLFLLALLGSGLTASPPAKDDGELIFALILSRHGISTPSPARDLTQIAAQPWPVWDTPGGHLTRHGGELMALMGGYYRQRYLRLGLLTGRDHEDALRLYFRSDSDERTVESARRLGQGLLPGGNPEIHARRRGVTDALFRPNLVPPLRPDYGLAQAAVLGRIGGRPDEVLREHRADYDLLQGILLGEGSPIPPGKQSLFAQPAGVGPRLASHIVSLTGPLRLGMAATDVILAEYVDGRPAAEVAWGRASGPTLLRLLQLHSLYEELTQRTFYPAQVQGSNLASHILLTLEQAAGGRRMAGAIGGPEARLVVVVGHDTNIANLGGLLGLSWAVPGVPLNPTLPGGALVFELRRRGDARCFVRVAYLAQTLEQMRGGVSLSVAQPPAQAPVFVPDASEASPGYDAPLPAFSTRLRQVIGAAFVVPQSL